jgi:hypothetical protein
MSRRCRASYEGNFSHIEDERPVEHHFNRAAFREHGFGSTGEQNTRQTCSRSRRAANSSAQPGMTRRSTGDRAN